MNALILRQVGLLLHIIGFTTAAGVTLVSYIASQRFLPLYAQDKEKGFAILHSVSRLPRVAWAGLLLLIFSGVLMISTSGGGYGQLQWFRIKMIIVLLIIAVSLFVTRRLDNRLHEQVLEDIAHGNKAQQIGTLARRIGYVQLCLLAFFLIIFVLIAFRFN